MDVINSVPTFKCKDLKIYFFQRWGHRNKQDSSKTNYNIYIFFINLDCNATVALWTLLHFSKFD